MHPNKDGDILRQPLALRQLAPVMGGASGAREKKWSNFAKGEDLHVTML